MIIKLSKIVLKTLGQHMRMCRTARSFSCRSNLLNFLWGSEHSDHLWAFAIRHWLLKVL